MKRICVFAALLALFACKKTELQVPRIVNIINFVRAVEPRDPDIDSRTILYETTLEQTRLLDRYGLTGTFLLQYDALIDPRYQELMKAEEAKGREVGAWWEITQPHVEDAGLQWRGRFPWDWHANVGFAIGYTPSEREVLADVYMEKFKSIFGHYPQSVGSWFIDAHTLGYLADKYGIVASCNCRDQVGTDGYTLWGGYWNQAYYPSRRNAYMPAQTPEGQIPLPVFRMLGSDPIYQYDMGLTTGGQTVVTLEPVYGNAGADKTWVERFFKSIFDDPALGFNYTQVGQENSFYWENMKEGLEMQIPLVAERAQKGDIQVMTLADAGKWFKKKYAVTPPTSVSCLEDTYDMGRKTVWFDSRFYRLNLLWENGEVKIRDMHLFNEEMPSAYVDKPTTTTYCEFMTLPIMDGFGWSSEEAFAGIDLCSEGGEKLHFDSIACENIGEKAIRVVLGREEGGAITFVMDESKVEIAGTGLPAGWSLVLRADALEGCPLDVESDTVAGNSRYGFHYGLQMEKGTLQLSDETIIIFHPDDSGQMILLPFV